MDFLLSRRRLMQASSSVVAAGMLDSIAVPAVAGSSGELRIVLAGGDVGKANIEALVKPFQAETGIKVTAVTDDISLAQIELMVKANSVTVDVVHQTPAATAVLNQRGLLEKIDYSIYKQEELDGIPEFARYPFGTPGLIYSYVMVYNVQKFPVDKPRPQSWAEFWDVKSFPGARSLMSGQYGVVGPWEEALLASGVAPNALYPMDINRIFSSLDNIKPHIRKWWASGSEIQQLLRDKVVDLAQTFDARAQLLIDQGAPLEINREQAKLYWNYWVIPKGSPNLQNAQKFIEFATRADRQAARARLIPYGPSNLNAYKLMPDELGRKLASHPDNMRRAIPVNAPWYAEIGPNGRSNSERLLERWNEWVLL